jgi:hypothetical protein
LCELKYEKPDKGHKVKTKPRTDSPVYALDEVITYLYHVLDNCKRLQDGEIYHANRRSPWDWKQCEEPTRTLLLVVANHTYWSRWKDYEPKSGKDAWSSQAQEVCDILAKMPEGLEVRFFSTPDGDFNAQAKQSDAESGKRYFPAPLIGIWTELHIAP